MKKTDGKELQNKLTQKWESVWNKLDNNELDELTRLGEEYKTFLDKAKTEREATKEIIRQAEEDGYVSLESLIENSTKVVPGIKIYANNKDKAVATFIIGKENLEKGMNIIASHVDSPRIDLKQFPL